MPVAANDDISPASVIPYEIVFAILIAMIAVFSKETLGALARVLIVLFVIYGIVAAVYYLAIKRDTWQVAPNDGSVSDRVRYSHATRRSSAAYIALNIILLAGAKILGVSYNSVWYNYIALFVTTMITYIYDRAVSTDDGLMHLKEQPALTLFDAFLSICSPSFMRYIIVLSCEISLTILIAYNFGKLIPSSCTISSTLFRKSIAPIVVYTIIGGPMRFAWAYPTVTSATRISYLTVYIICFLTLAFLIYASGQITPPTVTVGVIILMALIAMLLQSGGLSTAPTNPDLFTDVNNGMPWWLTMIFAIVILASILVIAYKIFVDYLQPFILVTNDPAKVNQLKQRRKSSSEVF